MNTKPLVSVLIRTKDRKHLLQEALQSVLAQTWQAIEVIIINDGGEDFSAAIVPSGADHIRWLNNTGKHGRSHAANLALVEARGEYCLFLDDDDSIDPAHLANLVAALETHPQHGAAYSSVRTMTHGVAETIPSFSYSWDPVRLLLENYIPIHAVLFRRGIVEEGCRFDPAFERFEDWDFWIQVAEKHDFLFVPDCTATYRIDASSGFGAKANKEEDMNAWRMAVYKKWLPRWSDSTVLELLDRSREFPRIAALGSAIDSLNSLLDKKSEQSEILKSTLSERTRAYLATRTELDDNIRLLQETEQNLADYWNYTTALQESLDRIHNSRSWKLTRPLRWLTRVLKQSRDNRTANVSAQEPVKKKAPVTDYTPLQFPACGKPVISIVLPAYNEHLFTFHCLQSILAHLGDEAVEVIVVNDQSTDATADMLAGISGIQVITNAANAGFIRTCNTGAARARGEFLVFLNNDTEVTPGWLEALRNTFAEFPDAGMVGARLLFGDGSLQEAGGIVWQDGSAWNYGRNDDPGKPEYNYCRQADYCSGACLMLRTEDFRALGGFDEHYLPAYYEDTDLAFRIRAMGKKVYYQPAASVIHFEGVTSGTDLDRGIKRYQRINQEKFLAKWREVLVRHRPHGRSPHLEKERHINRRILVIDARVLMPDRDSGSLRMFNIMRAMIQLGYKPTFVASNVYYDEHYTPMLQAAGIECVYTPYAQSVSRYLEEHGELFNAVILSRADHADRYIDEVRECCPRARVLFDTVDLHFLREQRAAELSGKQADIEIATWRKTQELRVARKADITLVVSPVEMALFLEEAPDVEVRLLSNVHQVHATAGSFETRIDILFIGSFEHPPNVDAMEYFLDDIFPLVLEKNPAIRLHIVGGDLPEHLGKRASENIIVNGFVSNIQPLFDSIRLSIAPLRYGAGVKGKINSSLSYGVPMVATSVAAEGMGLAHGKDILIADSPEQFAAQLCRLYEDAQLWQALSEAGKQNIETRFSFDVAKEQLRAVLPA